MIRTTVFAVCVVVFFSVIAEIKCDGVSRTKKACGSRRQQAMDDRGGEAMSDGCECGISKVMERGAGARIINGKPVRPPFKYPWMVGFFVDGTKSCGGSLISPTFVLTAAHCVADGRPDKKLNNSMCVEKGRTKPCYLEAQRLKIGYMGKSKDLSNFIPVKKCIPHPKYEVISKEYDFALLELKKPVSCSGYVRPICLPDNVPSMEGGSKSIVIGWGLTEKRKPSPVLLEAELDVQKKSQCKRPGKKTHICAKGKSQGVCMGDSGGPLMSSVKGKFYLFGVTSHGHSKLCDTRVPQFFSNVKQNLDWIHQYVR